MVKSRKIMRLQRMDIQNVKKMCMVKKPKLIPEIRSMTTLGMASYFECSSIIIKNMRERNTNELRSYGMSKYYPDNMKTIKCNYSYINKSDNTVFVWDNMQVTISKGGYYMFPLFAILDMVMLIPREESNVAKEIQKAIGYY